jgi:hypothetical protein
MAENGCTECGSMNDVNASTGMCAACSAGKQAGVAPPVEHVDTPHGAEPMETFQAEPPGTSGHDVNPELKVRR